MSNKLLGVYVMLFSHDDFLWVRNPAYQEITGDSVERFAETSASLKCTDACQTPEVMSVKD